VYLQLRDNHPQLEIIVMPACRRPPKDIVQTDYRAMTAAEMAVKHGVAQSTIRNWVAYYNIARKKQHGNWSPGNKIGSWKILERLPANRFGAVRWLVRCDCGKVGRKTTGHLRAAAEIGHACGCKKWTGAGDMPGKYWKGIMQKARQRGIPVEIEPEEAWKQFMAQDGLCALTGCLLQFGVAQNASLDRIRSDKGYINGNIQWVHKHINWMKNRFDNETFISYCRDVASHNAA
jgi:hypothetical protein